MYYVQLNPNFHKNHNYCHHNYKSKNVGSKQTLTDISEDINSYYLEMEVPGVNKEEFTLKVDSENFLKVTAGKEEKGKKFYQRKFLIPKNIDIENIKANLDNGILKITLPKQAEKITNITIN